MLTINGNVFWSKSCTCDIFQDLLIHGGIYLFGHNLSDYGAIICRVLYWRCKHNAMKFLYLGKLHDLVKDYSCEWQYKPP
jgi:hypothetical protein